MPYRSGLLLGSAVLALSGLIVGAGAAPAPASTAPAPTPTLACPPVLPLSATTSAVTATSVTVTYAMFLSPPCGYDPPVTVTVFTSRADAQQWLGPVTEVVSGPERSGQITVGGLTPDTEYWLRFSAGGRRDAYLSPAVRTAAVPACAATVHIDSRWDSGYVATVTVRNVGAEALNGWRVSWRWAGDERIQALWNASAQGGTEGVTVGNTSYNATVAPGGSTTFGMVVAAGGAPATITAACTR